MVKSVTNGKNVFLTGENVTNTGQMDGHQGWTKGSGGQV
jgi:hypothetical protein